MTISKTNPIYPKNWSTISHREFAGVYPVLEANARRHFRCAEILAKAGEHQNGIAHLILGTEELIKAFGCLLAAKRLRIKRQSWFGKLFYDHKTRHDLIKDFFSIYLLFTPLVDKHKKKPGFWGALAFAFGNIGMAAGNFYWWHKADELKQRALYVDYLEKIIDPADLSPDDYQTAYAYSSKFEREICSWMRKIEAATPAQLAVWERSLDLAKIDELRKQAYDAHKEISKFKKASG